MADLISDRQEPLSGVRPVRLRWILVTPLAIFLLAIVPSKLRFLILQELGFSAHKGAISVFVYNAITGGVVWAFLVWVGLHAKSCVEALVIAAIVGGTMELELLYPYFVGHGEMLPPRLDLTDHIATFLGYSLFSGALLLGGCAYARLRGRRGQTSTSD